MGKAIGANPETIVTDASRKLAALTAYVECLSRQAAETVAASELEIAALQAQIQEKRKATETAQQAHSQASRMCEAESDRLDDVLEFFSLDLPPSRLAPRTGGSV
jgi:erythromycin esterase-like protein